MPSTPAIPAPPGTPSPPFSPSLAPPASGGAGAASPGERLRAVGAQLKELGTKRLVLLGGAFAAVVLAVALGSAMLGPAAMETIYGSLDRRDAAAIGRELATLGIPHAVQADGTAIAVPVGRTDEARVALAERGLPASESGGYELFDQIGSLGLTSFMQEVTRLRALEGEIARSIRSIEGVSAARVHLVMADPGSFRRERREPSASIVISARSEAARRAAPSIRHLVAAAVPGLSVNEVTVLDDRGALLVAGGDAEADGLNASLRLVDQLERGVETKVARALEPFLGADRLRVSAKARIDTDREEVRETTFDPDGRVEREVRVEREERRSDRREADTPVTVEADLPDTGDVGGAGEATSETDERRTETTSYEINSRTTARVREAYRVDRLTVAVVVDRARLAELGGGAEPVDDAALAESIARIRRLAQSAAGMDEARGDVIEVTAVDFVAPSGIEGVVGGGAMALLERHAGTLAVALAFVLGLAALGFGLRPVAARLLDPAGGEGIAEAGDAAPRAGTAIEPAVQPSIELAVEPHDPADRLARLVEMDERRTALVLRRWINERTDPVIATNALEPARTVETRA